MDKIIKHLPILFLQGMKCVILLLLVQGLSSCADKKVKYLDDFAELVKVAQFHPAEKTDSDWEDVVDDRRDFMREKFVEIHSELSLDELKRIDSLDNVLKATILKHTKSQKVFEAVTKE